MQKIDQILVLGAGGLAGSAMVRKLKQGGYEHVFGHHNYHAAGAVIETDKPEFISRFALGHDLTSRGQMEELFAEISPQYVFMCAGLAGGILFHKTKPAEAMLANILMQTNVIEASRRFGVKKLLMLGSGAVYPGAAPSPVAETAIYTGPLLPDHQYYGMSKLAALNLCQAYRQQYGSNFIFANPTMLYGPGDNFNLETGHVMACMIRKFHEAKQEKRVVHLLGNGLPRREFLYSDDLAEACIFLMNHYDAPEMINIGSGQEVSIKELAHLIGQVMSFGYPIEFEHKTDNNSFNRKLFNSNKIHQLGWRAKTPLIDGIKQTYQFYLRQLQTGEKT